MRTLVIGSGGREHALIRALKRSASVTKLFCVPGNVGIHVDAEPIPVTLTDVQQAAKEIAQAAIDLVVVGPEQPLVEGLVDACKEHGVAVFGPVAQAAKLEGSKRFAKEIMDQAGVPTARWQHITTVEEGLAAVKVFPVVIKADGLAAGKGVTIAEDIQSAKKALTEIFTEQRFGQTDVIIEECLSGDELSLLAICDGERAIPLQPARDYKRIYDQNHGPNTGGMGAFSPVPGFDEERVDALVEAVHQPVVDLMRERGTPFHGILYAGLMFTDNGFHVIEFNVRFGDPEAQAVLPRLQSDLGELLLAATEPGGLRGKKLIWDESCSVTLVLASAGYPENPRTGDFIYGIDAVDTAVEITHAGTQHVEGKLATAGGRVLNITALADTVEQARAVSYEAASKIEFDGKQLRKDIAR